MGKWGIKISKYGNKVLTAESTGISFSSDSQNLMLLENKTLQWKADKGDDEAFGEVVYEHNLGYPPFTLGFLKFNFGIIDYPDYATELLLPSYATINTRGGTTLSVSVSLSIEDDAIRLNWSAYESVGGGGGDIPLTEDVNFTVNLNLYSLELGGNV